MERAPMQSARSPPQLVERRERPPAEDAVAHDERVPMERAVLDSPVDLFAGHRSDLLVVQLNEPTIVRRRFGILVIHAQHGLPKHRTLVFSHAIDVEQGPDQSAFNSPRVESKSSCQLGDAELGRFVRTTDELPNELANQTRSAAAFLAQSIGTYTAG